MIYIYDIHMIYIYMIYDIYIWCILWIGIRLRMTLISLMYIESQKFLPRVSHDVDPLAQDPYCTAPVKGKQWCAPLVDHLLDVRQIIIQDNKDILDKERPIHRLSAVGLPRSLRAGSCGPYKWWLKRTVAITHSHLLDMPPHQLPARSQILHRVLILVEAKPQNWDQAYPDDLWFPQEGDSYRQFMQSKTETVHLGKGDHLPDNRRLRWLRGLRRSLHLRIRLHRFRTLHHQG